MDASQAAREMTAFRRAQDGRSRWAFTFFLVYFISLLYCPPLLRDFALVSRGLRFDQLLLIVAFVWLCITTPRRILAAVKAPTAVALLVFTAAAGASALASLGFVPGATIANALAITWGQSRSLLVLVVATIIASKLDDDARLRLCHCLVALSIPVCILAILQAAGVESVKDFSLAVYSRKEGEEISDALDLGRAFGTFDGQPNVLGCFCVLILSVCITEIARLRGRRRLAVAVSIFIVAGALAVSWSRGAYGGTLIALTILIVQLPPAVAMRVGSATVAVGCGLYFVVPEVVRMRFSQLLSGRGDANQGSIFDARQQFWESNWRTFKEYPILGARGIQMDPADNLYLSLLALNGVAGLLCFLIVVVTGLWQLRARIRTPARAIALPLFAATVGWLVNGISIGSFFGERIQELYWILFALATAPYALTRPAVNQNRWNLRGARTTAEVA